jgi:hypothetical protein
VAWPVFWFWFQFRFWLMTYKDPWPNLQQDEQIGEILIILFFLSLSFKISISLKIQPNINKKVKIVIENSN